MEKFGRRRSEIQPELDGTVVSLHEASRVAASEEAWRTLEPEGEAICRKMTARVDRGGTKLLGRLFVRDREVISGTTFGWTIVMIIFLLATSICTCMADVRPMHGVVLWNMSRAAGFPAICVVLNFLLCCKLKQRQRTSPI